MTSLLLTGATPGCVTPEQAGGTTSMNIFPANMEKPLDAAQYLPWAHLLISNAKCFINGTHHAVNHLQGYLEEFSWRFNRRFCSLFARMLFALISYKPTYRIQ